MAIKQLILDKLSFYPEILGKTFVVVKNEPVSLSFYDSDDNDKIKFMYPNTVGMGVKFYGLGFGQYDGKPVFIGLSYSYTEPRAVIISADAVQLENGGVLRHPINHIKALLSRFSRGTVAA